MKTNQLRNKHELTTFLPLDKCEAFWRVVCRIISKQQRSPLPHLVSFMPDPVFPHLQAKRILVQAVDQGLQEGILEDSEANSLVEYFSHFYCNSNRDYVFRILEQRGFRPSELSVFHKYPELLSVFVGIVRKPIVGSRFRVIHGIRAGTRAMLYEMREIVTKHCNRFKGFPADVNEYLVRDLQVLGRLFSRARPAFLVNRVLRLFIGEIIPKLAQLPVDDFKTQITICFRKFFNHADEKMGEIINNFIELFFEPLGGKLRACLLGWGESISEILRHWARKAGHAKIYLFSTPTTPPGYYKGLIEQFCETPLIEFYPINIHFHTKIEEFKKIAMVLIGLEGTTSQYGFMNFLEDKEGNIQTTHDMTKWLLEKAGQDSNVMRVAITEDCKHQKGGDSTESLQNRVLFDIRLLDLIITNVGTFSIDEFRAQVIPQWEKCSESEILLGIDV